MDSFRKEHEPTEPVRLILKLRGPNGGITIDGTFSYAEALRIIRDPDDTSKSLRGPTPGTQPIVVMLPPRLLEGFDII
jgi:hypothetical protein